MANPFYTATGSPVAQSRGASINIRAEFTAIETAFGRVYAQAGASGGQVWTGQHNFTSATITVPTKTVGDNSANAASTAYVDQNFAPLKSPAFTDTPTAPTAPLGTDTNQIATMSALKAQAFSTVLPGQTGNAGGFLSTDGTAASWKSPVESIILMNQGIY